MMKFHLLKEKNINFTKFERRFASIKKLIKSILNKENLEQIKNY